MAAEEARQLLDQLMGGDRNAPLPKGAALPPKKKRKGAGELLLLPGKRSKSCYDNDICPLYCAWGVDVYELFVNTKSDIGPNPYKVDDAARQEFVNLPVHEQERLGFLYMLFSKLLELVQQCDRTVQRNQEKLQKELARQHKQKDFVQDIDDAAVEQLCRNQWRLQNLTTKLQQAIQDLKQNHHQKQQKIKQQQQQQQQQQQKLSSSNNKDNDNGNHNHNDNDSNESNENDNKDNNNNMDENKNIDKNSGDDNHNSNNVPQPKAEPTDGGSSPVVKKEEPDNEEKDNDDQQQPAQTTSSDQPDKVKKEENHEHQQGDQGQPSNEQNIKKEESTTEKSMLEELGKLILEEQRLVTKVSQLLTQLGPLQETVETQTQQLHHVQRDITTDKTVCEVSGNFMSARDADERIAAHYAGKQYVGWKLVRDKLKELIHRYGKYGPPPPQRGGGGGGPMMMPPPRGGGGGGGGPPPPMMHHRGVSGGGGSSNGSIGGGDRRSSRGSGGGGGGGGGGDYYGNGGGDYHRRRGSGSDRRGRRSPSPPYWERDRRQGYDRGYNGNNPPPPLPPHRGSSGRPSSRGDRGPPSRGNSGRRR